MLEENEIEIQQNTLTNLKAENVKSKQQETE